MAKSPVMRISARILSRCGLCVVSAAWCVLAGTSGPLVALALAGAGRAALWIPAHGERPRAREWGIALLSVRSVWSGKTTSLIQWVMLTRTLALQSRAIRQG